MPACLDRRLIAARKMTENLFLGAEVLKPFLV
jgi:hypothetical protein